MTKRRGGLEKRGRVLFSWSFEIDGLTARKKIDAAGGLVGWHADLLLIRASRAKMATVIDIHAQWIVQARYTIPDDVKLMTHEQCEAAENSRQQGYWYFRWGALHYYWDNEWHQLDPMIDDWERDPEAEYVSDTGHVEDAYDKYTKDGDVEFGERKDGERKKCDDDEVFNECCECRPE